MKEKTLDRALADTLTAAGERPVEAVFMLKSPPKGQLRGPQTRELVHKIIGRAESKASRKADSVAIFENLQSFALRAAAPPDQGACERKGSAVCEAQPSRRRSIDTSCEQEASGCPQPEAVREVVVAFLN
jgi:hypothetical protein